MNKQMNISNGIRKLFTKVIIPGKTTEGDIDISEHVVEILNMGKSYLIKFDNGKDFEMPVNRLLVS